MRTWNILWFWQLIGKKYSWIINCLVYDFRIQMDLFVPKNSSLLLQTELRIFPFKLVQSEQWWQHSIWKINKNSTLKSLSTFGSTNFREPTKYHTYFKNLKRPIQIQVLLKNELVQLNICRPFFKSFYQHPVQLRD